MAIKNVKINVKTDTGYDTLYPKTQAEIIDFDKTSSNLTSANVEAAIKEVNTKADSAKSTATTANNTANTANSTANTNKTHIGTLTSLTTDSKTNLVGAINEVDSHANSAQSTANTANSTANTANSTANTNKTNIGTLSSLKTSVKTSIVNAINNLYDLTIGRTLKTLDEIKVVTQNGYYADALAIKNFVRLFDGNSYGYKTPNSIVVIGSKVLSVQSNSYFQLFTSSELRTLFKQVDSSFNEDIVLSKMVIHVYNGDTAAFPAHLYCPEYDSGSSSIRIYFSPERGGGGRLTYRLEYLLN